MLAKTFLRNKINRQVLWNGREFVFIRYKQNSYHEPTDEVELEITIRGVFHDGGGYGGMLNYELYERDGSREVSKMKPMVVCLYDDVSSQIQMGDKVEIDGSKYFVVEKNDVTKMQVLYEISLEQIEDMKQ